MIKGFTATCLATLGILTLGSGIARASALSLGAATGYNAFVFSNFTETSTDSQGRLAVGGDFAPANGGSFTIASQHGGDGAGIYDLVVGGNFTNVNATLGGGDAFVGGNMTWSDPSLPHNVYVNGNFSNPANGGSVGGSVNYKGTYSSGTALTHTHETSATPAPIDFLSAKTDLQSLSATLASQAVNGSTTFDGYSTYTLSGNNSTDNIFTLNGSTFNGRTINITAPAGSTVIVNVTGTADSFNGGSINFTGVTANDVIFNFNSAASLALSSISFNGTILAPGADFTGTWGQINGQLIAKSAAGTTELHDVLFNGSLADMTVTTAQNATPEPSTWMLIVGGVMLIGLAKRRA